MTSHIDNVPRHHHNFLGLHHERNERRTWLVVGVTAAMMVGEIAGGTFYGSMALVADGWHMSTHAAALTVAALAYGYARKHADNPRYTFGTGKVGELAGFASAVVLGVIALIIGWESAVRLLHPRPISFGQATVIATLGLMVNLVSAWLLHQGDHGHSHGHEEHQDDHDHDHDDHDDAAGAHHGHHQDTNIRAAYLHVVADAMTSVLAIAGLLAGRFLGWVWMDPLIGIIGALVISSWSWSLLRTASASLLDASADPHLAQKVRARLEHDGDTVSDLHLWRVGPGHFALIVAVESAAPAAPDAYKVKLSGLHGLSHMTVEVNARS